ncbi:hypothetical protein [Holophaga foetida]|uniref:hypothetical protein n=1 Tax=Holophaga foetida TaxID=35839 RepID=UPI0002472AC0|nr:hypothetical protein [Holophaga foetida]
MEAAAQLAIMAKATQVFGSEGTFLSFPITPLAFPPQALDLAGDPSFGRLIEFSALVNRIPDGNTWSSSGEMLWDIYRKITKEGEFAESSRTDGEESDYQAACALLFTQSEDGLRSPSQAALSYGEYRDQYKILEQDYLVRKATAMAGNDAAKAEWTEATEPPLLEDLNQALSDWATLGFRFDIEQAQEQVRLLGAKSPLLTRGEWMKRFDSDLDTLTRPSDQMRVFSTSFMPANAVAEGAWKSFELSGAEVDAFLTEASSGQAGAPSEFPHDIKSIRFEFSSAALLRPWFAPEALTARFWRFADPSLILSDGAAPPRGLCPAYPVALVFARKVQVEKLSGAPGPLPVQPLVFDPATIAVLHQFKPRILPRPRVEFRGKAPLAVFRPLGPGNLQSKERLKPLNLLAGRRLPVFQRRIQPPIPHKLPETPQSGNTDETIQILAFLCKRLPKSPDPDFTTYRW